MTQTVLSQAVNMTTLAHALDLIKTCLQVRHDDISARHFKDGDEHRWTHGSGRDRAKMLTPWLCEELADAGYEGPVTSTAEEHDAAVARDTEW